jgi:hypothetical protein
VRLYKRKSRVDCDELYEEERNGRREKRAIYLQGYNMISSYKTSNRLPASIERWTGPMVLSDKMKGNIYSSDD